MPAGKPCGEPLEHGAHRAIARIPHHGKRPVPARGVLEKAGDISLARLIEGNKAEPSRPARHAPFCSARPELLDRRPIERLALQHHLEAVVVGRVVAAGDHHRPVIGTDGGVEIEHRGGTEADQCDLTPRGEQPGGEHFEEGGRGEPPVIAHHHPAPAAFADQAPKDETERRGILLLQRLADDPPHIVFAEQGGGETVAEAGAQAGGEGAQRVMQGGEAHRRCSGKRLRKWPRGGAQLSR